jgi:hypothetical protein
VTTQFCFVTIFFSLMGDNQKSVIFNFQQDWS